MEKLRITLTIEVDRDADKDGATEIYVRSAVDKARDIIDLVARGKVTIERKLDVINGRKLVKFPKQRRKQ